MASICNDDWASLGVMSGHERKTLRLSALAGRQRAAGARIENHVTGLRSEQKRLYGCDPM